MRDTSGLGQNNIFKPAKTQSEALIILGVLLAKRSVVSNTLAENADDKADQEAFLQRQKTALQTLAAMLTAWLNLPDV